ncbi:peptide deformylase [Mycoplasma sp. ATU-Cv-703]|uniref:peptide deformylase n=1 Tax=Mycoplasma sp. ATU-Cv-703 TaxID=2498595 RepID=UPI000FDDD151
MKIILLPNKKLRSVSAKVKLPLSEADQKLAEQMIHYVDSSQKKDSSLREGIGIAAVQMGHLKRMFYVNVPPGEFHRGLREFLINPEITAYSPSYAALEQGEGCLSVDPERDDQAGLVHRRFKVVIQGYSYLNQKKVTHHLTGVLAIVFQHEMDHLDGKLYLDRIDYRQRFKPRENEVIF